MSILPYDKALDKWEVKKAASVELARKMSNASRLEREKKHTMTADKLLGRAFRMNSCSDRIDYEYCLECGSMHIARAYLCRDRLCPICAWRLALKRTAEMMAVLSHLHASGQPLNAAMLTLTIKNCDLSDLGTTIGQLLKGWKAITKRRKVAKYILGYCRSLEITRGKDNSMHPHLHILVFFADGYTAEISQREWSLLWKEAIEVEYIPIVDIRKSYNPHEGQSDEKWRDALAATVEACKYAVKDGLTASVSAAELTELTNALQGRVLCAYGGIIRKARKELRLKDNDSADAISAATIECPKCGCTATVILSYEWAQGSYLLHPYNTGLINN